MKRNIKKSSFVLLCVVSMLMLSIWGYVQSYAADLPTTLPEEYHFVFNSTKVSNGAGYTVIGEETQVYVSDANDKIETKAVIEWVSSDKYVLEADNTDTTRPHMAKLTRKGPGYSMITAMIIKDGNIYNISCQVMVELEIDYSLGKTKFKDAKWTGDRVTPLAIGASEKVHLKYKTDNMAVSGSAVTWTPGDESVATVDSEGNVTGKGAGSTTIRITTNTSSTNNEQQEVLLTVVVEPLAKDPGDNATYKNDFTIDNSASDFIIYTNALKASNLTWHVYDNKGTLITADDKSKLEYYISTNSGNFEVRNAKAGTYDIYAFVKSDYTSATNVKYLHIKVIVPVRIINTNIVMNVKDTYSLLQNTNIPLTGAFNYSFVDSNGVASTIAQINQNTGVITANSKGNVRLILSYIASSGLFDNFTGTIPPINITIIDGIALNTMAATIYTAGTLQLVATTTYNGSIVTWTSSDEKIAKVEKGLVTGVAEGQAVITATQIVDGVAKTASCIITVQKSISKIKIDPSNVSLNIGENATLTAEVEPSDLNNVSLKWVSSNESIVKITKPYDVTAIIQGVAGGTAVISAINQENVVVGFCQVVVKQKVTGITLSETTISLPVSSKSVQLRAIVTPFNATNQTIKWSSTNVKVATVDTYGVVSIVGAGTASIIATSEDNPAVTAICNIIVEVPVNSITLDETTKTMYVGETTRLSYLITPINASAKSVIWSSFNSAVVSVDSTGLVTAKGAGQGVISVKTADGTVTHTCTITVKQKATGFTFDVKDLELDVGQSYSIEVSVTPKDSTEFELTWESLDTKVAIVDKNGKVTGMTAGKTAILAKTSEGKAIYCNVTVVQPLTGIQLNFEKKSLVKGQSFNIKATLMPSSAPTTDVVWSTSDGNVASVSSTGKVTGIKSGAVIITCKSKDGKFTAICTVSVIEPVTSIKLNKTSYKLGVGKTLTLKATIKSNAASNPKVTWSSSNKKIATVDSKGKVTAIKLGYATITAKAQDGSGMEASCEIRVVTPVTSISLNRSSITTIEGRSFQLKATVKPVKATFKYVTWSSSDNSVAVVDSKGLVTVLKEGKVTITAKSRDDSGKSATCFVIVLPLTPSTSVTILNQNLTMVVGETNTLQIAINPTNSTDRYTWQSDNKTVASVDKSTGKIAARTPGIASVTVMTTSGKKATTKVTVVGLNTNKLELEQYTKYRLSVIGVTSGVTWDIEDNSIAVITGGLVEAKRTGTTNIIATVNGRRLACKLTVIKIR